MFHIEKFLLKWLAEAAEAAEVPKDQKITTEDFTVILDLEVINLMTKIILFSYYENKNILRES